MYTMLEWNVSVAATQGSMSLKAAYGALPLRLTPPVRSIDTDATSAELHTCAAAEGEYWIALVGEGTVCSGYSISAAVSTGSGDCPQTENDEIPPETEALPAGVFVYGKCEPGQYVDYEFELDADSHADANVFFEVRAPPSSWAAGGCPGANGRAPGCCGDCRYGRVR